jgi:SAM-dependent methyltransferase
MKLHLGCGNDKRKGYINLDSSMQVNPDVVWNLEKTPIPFKNDSIDEILANHIFEHITNFIPLMNDIHRICRKNAIIKIRTPFYSAWGQYNDPTHVRFFTPFTFNYFEGDNNYSHEVKNNNKINFKVEKVKIHFGIGKSKILNKLIDPLINLNQKFYCRFFAFIIPAAEIQFELRVIK